jgi:hypothetical protein
MNIMKRLAFFLFLLVLTASCKHQLVSTPPEEAERVSESVEDAELVAGTQDPASEVLSASLSFRAQELRGHMEVLSADSLRGRRTGDIGFDRAADYLIGELRKYAIGPYYADYKSPMEGYDVPAYNVLAKIPGSDPRLRDEWIVIGAHLDHIGTAQPVDGDSIANGANDNAAGSVMILELAKQLSRSRMARGRSVLFAWFTAEESGLVGSNYLARKLKKEGFDPYLMLNFEMVGVPMTDKDYQVYVTGYEMSNLADVCNQYAETNLVGFLPKAKEFNLFQRSDNLGFYKEFNIPAQTFSSFDFTNYDYYHHVNDEAVYLDYEFMAGLVDDFLPVVRQLVNQPEQVVKLK